MYYGHNNRQFASDVHDVRVLKFGRTGSNFWAYLQMPAVENPEFTNGSYPRNAS